MLRPRPCCSFPCPPAAPNRTTNHPGRRLPAPHAQILKAAEPLLKEKGYTLVIQEFSDYVLPNNALEEGSLDANFFQHEPYLLDFNQENGTHLVAVANIHYEPMGVYAGKSASLDSIPPARRLPCPAIPPMRPAPCSFWKKSA